MLYASQFSLVPADGAQKLADLLKNIIRPIGGAPTTTISQAYPNFQGGCRYLCLQLNSAAEANSVVLGDSSVATDDCGYRLDGNAAAANRKFEREVGMAGDWIDLESMWLLAVGGTVVVNCLVIK